MWYVCTVDCTHPVFVSTCNPDHVPLTSRWALHRAVSPQRKEHLFSNSQKTRLSAALLTYEGVNKLCFSSNCLFPESQLTMFNLNKNCCSLSSFFLYPFFLESSPSVVQFLLGQKGRQEIKW